ncbi:MAG: PQQ-binding-like beta-propeller repeat protein, partial [Planctomycetaceae bacterium]
MNRIFCPRAFGTVLPRLSQRVHFVALLLVLAGMAFSTVRVQAQPSANAADQAASDIPSDVRDWVYWRGPNFDGTSATTNLPESFDPEGGEGSNVLWKSEEFAGRSTPVVLNGKLYTTLRAEPGTPREGERVVCLDAKTGELIWENRFNVWLSDVPDTRIGWASVTADPETGNIYCLGVCDYFVCIDGQTGKTIWGVPLHEQFGMLSTYGGRTNFPVVFEDLVMISGVITNWGDRARPNHRFLAFDKRTGECVWFNGTVDQPDDTTYSGPSIVTIDGQKQLVVGVGDGACWTFQPRTGKPLTNYQISIRGLFTTPLVAGNMIYASHSEENVNGATMGSVEAIKVTGVGSETKVEPVWRVEQLMVGRAAPLLIDDRLYVINDTCKMVVLDAKTGETIGNRITLGDRKQYGSMLYADGKIYVLTENGHWAILRPTEDGAEMLDKGGIRGESFNASPIVADGRIYFLGNKTLYCLGKSADGPVTFDPKLIHKPEPELAV